MSEGEQKKRLGAKRQPEDGALETDPAEVADVICKLVNEYTAKLQEFVVRAERALDEIDKERESRGGVPHRKVERFRSFQAYLHSLLPGIDDLNRHASQLIEHGKIGTTVGVELRIRTRELEAIRTMALSLVLNADLH